MTVGTKGQTGLLRVVRVIKKFIKKINYLLSFQHSLLLIKQIFSAGIVCDFATAKIGEVAHVAVTVVKCAINLPNVLLSFPFFWLLLLFEVTEQKTLRSFDFIPKI